MFYAYIQKRQDETSMSQELLRHKDTVSLIDHIYKVAELDPIIINAL